jgi:hypothetical protein
LNQPYLRMILLTDPTRSELVVALTGMIEAEIGKSRGARGLALRHALRTTKKHRPGALARLVNDLIPEWIDILEPHYEVWSSKGTGSFGTYVVRHQDDLAHRLLEMVQTRVRASNHRVAGTVAGFMGVDALRRALPRFGVLVDNYVSVA